MRQGDTLHYGHGARVVLGKANRRLWLAQRRKGITATDVPAILNQSPYKTAFRVWCEKTGRDDGQNLEGEYPVARGSHMEAFLLAWWERVTPGGVLIPPPPLIAHPTHTWLMASLDGIGYTDAGHVVLEAKTAGWRAKDDWWDDGTCIPDHYAMQVLTQLWVTGLEEAHVVADVAGEWEQLVIRRDRDWEAAVLPVLEAFRAQVAADTPPEDPHPTRDWPMFNRTWLTAPKTSREATPAEQRLLRDWAQWRHAKTAVDELRGYVRIAMRDVQQLTIGGLPAATNTKAGLRAGKALQEETQ